MPPAGGCNAGARFEIIPSYVKVTPMKEVDQGRPPIAVSNRHHAMVTIASDDRTRTARGTGRVPGAVHLEWLNFVTAYGYNTFRSADGLRTMLAERVMAC